MGILLILSFGALAQPQPDNAPPRERRPARTDRPQGAFQPGANRGQFFPVMERVLTEEQKESLRSKMESQRETMRPLEAKLRDARRELLEASLGKFDEDAIRAKALEVGKLDAELTVLRAKAFSQMKPSLSAEQIEQLKNLPLNPAGEGRPGNVRQPNRGASRERDENDLPPKPSSQR